MIKKGGVGVQTRCLCEVKSSCCHQDGVDAPAPFVGLSRKGIIFRPFLMQCFSSSAIPYGKKLKSGTITENNLLILFKK